jgi:hypothetical protein
MNKFFLNTHTADPGKGQTPSGEIPETLYPYEHDINTSDGGEFLDDAIRMKEQPFGNTGVTEENDQENSIKPARSNSNLDTIF